MKKHLTLFSRLFITLSAVVLTAVLLMSVVTVSVLQRERQAAYEYEILSQLRGVSDILEESYYIHDLRLNNTLSRLIREKMSSIYAKYKGTIWVVNWNSSGQNVVLFLDSDWTNTETLIYEEDVMYQFDRIRKGHEIRETGLIPDLGNDIVTLGVPWTYRTYQDEIVVGAVLMHVNTNDLTVNLSDLLPQILLVACLVLSLGLVLSATVARSQSRPIRQMQSIVAEFARGDFGHRVDIQTSAELMLLADAINRMADDLENLETSRREFVANVSHELRSPLMSIQGYLHALEDGTAQPEERTQFLSIVISETQRLSKLVNDLLALSRMDSGAYQPNFAPFDLNEMVRRAFISVLPRIEEKGIEPDMRLDENLPTAYGDADRLRQVVNNLLDNAVKFAGENGKISVETSASGTHIRLIVNNDGETIPEEDLPHIFDRFYKVDKAHTAGQGTGLGLAIAQRIVMQHRGTITAKSENGITTFCFEIPICQSM